MLKIPTDVFSASVKKRHNPYNASRSQENKLHPIASLGRRLFSESFCPTLFAWLILSVLLIASTVSAGRKGGYESGIVT